MAFKVAEKNYTGTAPDALPSEPTLFVRCNFARTQPAQTGEGTARGVRLWPGDDTPRVFQDCNLMNCELPPGSRTDNCNTWIVETGVTPAQKPDDVVEVDGVEISREVYHDRINYGKWTEEGYQYITPILSPEDYV